MTLPRRLALLEATHTAALDAMGEAELCARLDATYGPGTGAFMSAYMDECMTLAELEALHAGDQRLAQRVWSAYDAWKETL